MFSHLELAINAISIPSATMLAKIRIGKSGRQTLLHTKSARGEVTRIQPLTPQEPRNPGPYGRYQSHTILLSYY